MAGVVNLISRRPRREPVHEFLFNRSTLGATDASALPGIAVFAALGRLVLGSGDWQQRNDLDDDGWADLAGYSRGVVRPRFFWDGGNGRTAFLTGGVTYENRDGGTLPGAVLPATGAPYTEALNTRRYDVGGNFQFLVAERYVVDGPLRRILAGPRSPLRRRPRTRSPRTALRRTHVRGTFHRNTWVAGVAAEREAYRPRDVPHFTYRYTTPGVFLQDDIDDRPLAFRLRQRPRRLPNRYGTFLSPRVSALLRWRGWTSRLSAGQGFFAPTPLDRGNRSRRLNPSRHSQTAGRRARAAAPRLISPAQFGPTSYTVTLFDSSVRHPINVERGDRYQLINLTDPPTIAAWSSSARCERRLFRHRQLHLRSLPRV